MWAIDKWNHGVLNRKEFRKWKASLRTRSTFREIRELVESEEWKSIREIMETK
jgi:hypothetical protein